MKNLQGSGVIHYSEPFSWLDFWAYEPGAPLLLLCAFGLMRLKNDEAGGGLAPASFLGATVFLFGVFGGAWRVYSLITSGRPDCAFTPSRFLTDAAYPAGALAGVCLARAFEGKRRATIVAACLLLGPAALAEPWLWLKGAVAHPVVPPDIVNAVSECEPLIPRDAFVIADIGPDEIAPCLLSCECAQTSKTVSEPNWLRSDMKRRFAEGVLAGRQDRELRAALVGSRPVVVITAKELPADATPAFRKGRLVAGMLGP